MFAIVALDFVFQY